MFLGPLLVTKLAVLRLSGTGDLPWRFKARVAEEVTVALSPERIDQVAVNTRGAALWGRGTHQGRLSMKRRLIVVAIALTAGACAKPVVTGGGRDSITIMYDPVVYSRAEIHEQATQHCRQYGASQARFAGTSQASPIGLGHDYDRFDCLP